MKISSEGTNSEDLKGVNKFRVCFCFSQIKVRVAAALGPKKFANFKGPSSFGVFYHSQAKKALSLIFTLDPEKSGTCPRFAYGPP